MREYAQRFLQMEERIARETAEMKAEFGRRLESLEAHNRLELESLADRLNAERSPRADSEERISRELNNSIKSLDQRLRQTDEQGARDLRELRQLMLDRQRALSDDVRQSLATAGTAHDRRLEELRASAVDRFTLADLFAELSLRMGGEFRIPGEGNSTDAGADR
jgi:seryl-tRNA synthetase